MQTSHTQRPSGEVKKPVPVVRTATSTSIANTPPILMGEIKVQEIRIGSVLTVTTEAHIYTFNINGIGQGILMTNNTTVRNGLVVLHGSWDYDRGEPVWNWISRGKGLLFAHLPDVQSATKTSPVVKISLSRKGL